MLRRPSKQDPHTEPSNSSEQHDSVVVSWSDEPSMPRLHEVVAVDNDGYCLSAPHPMPIGRCGRAVEAKPGHMLRDRVVIIVWSVAAGAGAYHFGARFVGG